MQRIPPCGAGQASQSTEELRHRRCDRRGRFSYIYATEPGSGTDVVIKEYYPASGALRDERTQCVLPAPGQETVFQQNLAQFAREGFAGDGRARELSDGRFSRAGGRLCRAPALEPVCAVSALVRRWKEEPPAPYSGREGYQDPCFPDLPRVQYALRVTESVPRGARGRPRGRPAAPRHQRRQRRLGGAGAADGPRLRGVSDGFRQRGGSFGRRARRGAAVIQPRLLPRRSCAPPARRSRRRRISTPLACCCFISARARGALQLMRFPKKAIRRELGRLRVQGRGAGRARSGLLRTAAPQSERYQTAGQIRSGRACAARAAAAPPGEPTPARDFTLASLRSLLEGDRDGGYGWAEELRDRRGTSIELPPDTERGVSGRMFADGGAFCALCCRRSCTRV